MQKLPILNTFPVLRDLGVSFSQYINNMVAASMKKFQVFLRYSSFQSETPVTVPPMGKCTVVTHSLPWLDIGRTANVESSSVTAKGIISWQSLAHLSMSDFLPDLATISRAGIPQHGARVRGSTITTMGRGRGDMLA